MKKIKYFDEKTRTWKTRIEKDDPNISTRETYKLTEAQLKASGMLKGMKYKTFSEMTEEEQKLFNFNDDDCIEG